MLDSHTPRQWSTTAEVGAGLTLPAKKVKRRLELLYDAGILERSLRGDGMWLWRFAPDVADALSRTAKR